MTKLIRWLLWITLLCCKFICFVLDLWKLWWYLMCRVSVRGHCTCNSSKFIYFLIPAIRRSKYPSDTHWVSWETSKKQCEALNLVLRPLVCQCLLTPIPYIYTYIISTHKLPLTLSKSVPTLVLPLLLITCCASQVQFFFLVCNEPIWLAHHSKK
jgi:hypothetical protein